MITAFLPKNNGLQFLSRLFETAGTFVGVKHLATITYHHRTNGRAERYNKTLLTCLLHYVASIKRDWDLFYNQPRSPTMSKCPAHWTGLIRQYYGSLVAESKWLIYGIILIILNACFVLYWLKSTGNSSNIHFAWHIESSAVVLWKKQSGQNYQFYADKNDDISDRKLPKLWQPVCKNENVMRKDFNLEQGIAWILRPQ